MNYKALLFFLTITLSGIWFSKEAQIIKIGSLAPGGSPWDNALRKIAAEWSTISKGSVTLKIYPGGVAGDEEDMIRKMRLNQLNAAGLTGVGMSRVFPGILAVQLPLLIRNDKELYYILDKMEAKFENELENKGFKVILWSKVGWVHFFSKNPVVKPDDLRAHKMFNYAGDPDGTLAWKEAGFNPVPLSPTELMTSLQSGMVNAFSTTPLSAASYQWFGLAKNMCNMKWAPLIGGVVVSMNTWNKIPADIRQGLLASAKTIGKQMQIDIDGADAQAIIIMKQNGLKINNVPLAIEGEWNTEVQKGFSRLIGKSFDKESYDTIKNYLITMRQSNGK